MEDPFCKFLIFNSCVCVFVCLCICGFSVPVHLCVWVAAEAIILHQIPEWGVVDL